MKTYRQVLQKKTLTTADYPKWGDLRLDKMSENGQWISYTKSYESGLDTLYIKNTKSLETKAFPLGNGGNFLSSDWFIYQTDQGVHLINLKTEKQETIAKASQYIYSPTTKKLLLLVTEKGNTLLIRELNGTAEERIKAVNEFIMDPTEQMILYTATRDNQNTINLLQLSKKKSNTVLLSGSSSFSNLAWHEKGKAVAFIQKSLDNAKSGTAIFYYNLSNKKLCNSNTENQRRFFGDSLFISTTPPIGYNLKISDDLHSVFFTVQRRKKSTDTIKDSDVQLWNGNAKWIYPQEKMNKKGIYLGLWHPQEDRYQLISNDTLSKVMLTGNQHYAIISNTKQYEPQYSNYGPRDSFLVDLSTGKKELFLKKHSSYAQHTIASPDGKYIAYFKQKNWWIYNIAKKTHINITKTIGQSFFHNDSNRPQTEESYPNLGWTLKDKEILLCDQYDIWAINPDGTSAHRLTHGRETQTQFRLAVNPILVLGTQNYDGGNFNTVDLNKGLLLQTTNNKGDFAFYRSWPKSIENLVTSTNTRLDQLIQSTTDNTFVYREQSWELPPQLMLLSSLNKTPKVLVKSNLQQQQFHWGKSEPIQYKNTKGEYLHGILYYPAEYDPKKKYPMIVYIYEKLAKYLHNRYLYPSQFTGEDESFNIISFTTQGYFVLAPDISYEIGAPGISATDCVVSATNEIISRGLVVPNKIGLIGHSFGGYETDFIITQTNLFAAAVAGSAATDLTSFYLTVGWYTGRPDMWRFESQQWRLEKSLFEARESYDRNSPIVYAKNITTPLLSWTGGDDKQVNWSQSIEFYLALRRLEKQHIMLLYPKEGHVLNNSQNQKDLSTRIHQWFDYHLKDMPAAAWIKTGLK